MPNETGYSQFQVNQLNRAISMLDDAIESLGEGKLKDTLVENMTPIVEAVAEVEVSEGSVEENVDEMAEKENDEMDFGSLEDVKPEMGDLKPVKRPKKVRFGAMTEDDEENE